MLVLPLYRTKIIFHLWGHFQGLFDSEQLSSLAGSSLHNLSNKPTTAIAITVVTLARSVPWVLQMEQTT
jgi:hypothetical protein